MDRDWSAGCGPATCLSRGASVPPEELEDECHARGPISLSLTLLVSHDSFRHASRGLELGVCLLGSLLEEEAGLGDIDCCFPT